MTLYFPDISSFQGAISLTGAPAVAIKTTEGTGWADPQFSGAVGRARLAGAFPIAYHFMHAGNPAGQAAWAHAHAAGLPLMLDVEPTGSSRPRMADATGFIDAFRKLGGTCNLVYWPRWFWSQIGSPSLSGLASRKCALWSSAYTGYTDDGHGVGWMPYGGLTPSLWQYTDAHSFHGQKVDFSAFRGTLDQLKHLAGAGTSAPPARPVQPGKAPPFPYPSGHYLGQPSSSPYCHSGYYGGTDTASVAAWQTQMHRRGWKAITQDGCYGPQSDQTCRAFQAEKGLPVDGLCGAATWTAAWTAAVTP